MVKIRFIALASVLRSLASLIMLTTSTYHSVLSDTIEWPNVDQKQCNQTLNSFPLSQLHHYSPPPSTIETSATSFLSHEFSSHLKNWTLLSPNYADDQTTSGDDLRQQPPPPPPPSSSAGETLDCELNIVAPNQVKWMIKFQVTTTRIDFVDTSLECKENDISIQLFSALSTDLPLQSEPYATIYPCAQGQMEQHSILMESNNLTLRYHSRIANLKDIQFSIKLIPAIKCPLVIPSSVNNNTNNKDHTSDSDNNNNNNSNNFSPPSPPFCNDDQNYYYLISPTNRLDANVRNPECTITLIPSTDTIDQAQASLLPNETIRWRFQIKLTRLSFSIDHLNNAIDEDAGDVDSGEHSMTSSSNCHSQSHLRLWTDGQYDKSVLLCQPVVNYTFVTSELNAISLDGFHNISLQIVPPASLFSTDEDHHQQQQDQMQSSSSSSSSSSSMASQDLLIINEFCFQHSIVPVKISMATLDNGAEKLDDNDKVDADSSLCPLYSQGGWYKLGNYCYKVFSNPMMNRFEAQKFCNSLANDGHLASIVTQDIQRFIEKLISRYQSESINFGHQSTSSTVNKEAGPADGNDDGNHDDDSIFYWIGATDMKHENHFQWDDGQISSFTNWFHGWRQGSEQIRYAKQPSDDGASDQDCVELKNRFKYPSKGYGSTGNLYYWNDISCESSNGFVCQTKFPVNGQENSIPSGLTTHQNCGRRIVLGRYHTREIIESPTYPSIYPNNFNCSYLITCEDKSHLVELVFIDFNLEDKIGESCDNDFLSIRIIKTINITNPVSSEFNYIDDDNDNDDGESKFCGDYTSKIKHLRTVGPTLLLTMVTDGSYGYRGFQAEARLISHANQQHTFHSNHQHYHREFHHDKLLCDDETFKPFQGDCYSLFVYPEVSWGTATRICHDIGAEIVVIRDYDDEKRLIEYLQMNLIENQASVPSKSRSTTAAFWISLSHGSLFSTKEVFSRPTSDDGPDDDSISKAIQEKMAIFEPVTSSDESLATSLDEDSSQACHTFTINKSRRNLVYSTIDCAQQAGFVCKKKAIDLGEIRNISIRNQTSGKLSSPNYPNNYINGLNYHVNISSKYSDAIIVIWFNRIDIEGQAECEYDHLRITEYPESSFAPHSSSPPSPASLSSSLFSLSKPFTEKICGTLGSPEALRNLTYFSRINHVTVSFHTDHEIVGTGFELEWQIIRTNWCKQPFTFIPIHTSGILESPGYPHWTLPSSNCSLTLIAPNNCLILLTILDFELGHVNKAVSDSPCRSRVDWSNEFVLLNLDSVRNVTLCGSIGNKDILEGQQFISYGPRLTMIYQTRSRKYREPINIFRGFKLKYEVITNHQRVKTSLKIKPNTSGRITSINYPHQIPSNFNYTVFLRTDVEHNIELKIPSYLNLSMTNRSCSETIGVQSSMRSPHHNSHINHNNNHHEPSHQRQNWPILSIVDSFGSIDVNPSVPNTRYLCSINSKIKGLPGRRINVFRSRFHSLKVEITNIFQHQNHHHHHHDNFQQQQHHYHHNMSIESGIQFQLLYRTYFDKELANLTRYLARDFPVDTCEYNPCSSNGQCVMKYAHGKNVSICECTGHWTGLFCHLTLCDVNPCSDNGICRLKDNDYVCHCHRGFTGKNCLDTITTCDRMNPCSDRGTCSLINGHMYVCECHAWYEGQWCHKLKYRINYKPLSQRMLEEPFWLGLITVAIVLAIISLVYLLKKKFAERIEKFFEEEIEKSKTLTAFGLNEGSGHRYSLTSNYGLSTQLTPNSRSPPLPRSRSSLIGRICKRSGRSSNAGHLSDSEVAHRKDKDDVYSDSEAGGHGISRRRFRPMMLFSKSATNSSSDLVTSFDREEKSRLLSTLVSGRQERRMSLDEFFRFNEAKIRNRNTFSSDSRGGDSSSDAEKHSPVTDHESFEPPLIMQKQYKTINSRKLPSLLHFHAIRENSQEDQESGEYVRSPIAAKKHDWNDEHNKRLDTFMNQDSELGDMLHNIDHIQAASSKTCHCGDKDRESCGGLSRPRSSLRVKRSPSPRRMPSGDISSSSDSGSPNRIQIPGIMVTRASVEYQSPSDSDAPHTNTSSIQDTVIMAHRQYAVSSYIEKESPVDRGKIMEENISSDGLALPNDPMQARRSSEPPSYSMGKVDRMGENYPDQTVGEDSEAHETKMNKIKIDGRHGIQESACRKLSLELLIPQIKINGSEEVGESSGHSKLRRTVNASNVTISESNLSTSGYSSLSSPGISRTNSSSPVLEEVLSTEVDNGLREVFIPESTGNAIDRNQMFPKKSSSGLGNFLTIPSYNYAPQNQSSLKRRIHRSKENLKNIDGSGPSTSGQSPARRRSYDPNMMSANQIGLVMESNSKQQIIEHKRERLIAMKRFQQTLGSLHSDQYAQSNLRTHSFDGCIVEREELNIRPDSASSESSSGGGGGSRGGGGLRKPPIQRNPSWPGLIKSITTSSDSDEPTALDLADCQKRSRADESAIRQCRSPGPSRKLSRQQSSKRLAYQLQSKSSQSLHEYQPRSSVPIRRSISRTDSYPRYSSEKLPYSIPVYHHQHRAHADTFTRHSPGATFETSSTSSSSSSSYETGEIKNIRTSTRSLNLPFQSSSSASPSPTSRTIKSVSPRSSFRRGKSEYYPVHSSMIDSPPPLLDDYTWSKPYRINALKKETRKMSISDTALSLDLPKGRARNRKSWLERRAQMKSPSQSLPTAGESEEIEVILPIRNRRRQNKAPSSHSIQENPLSNNHETFCPEKDGSSDDVWSKNIFLVKKK
ncbi:uncharacterized protein LOC141855792 [Brevipalpus obovatus]|uniref:uncharacterized protein LOC141855792 n=1 Tax=Brevipalpus obovatus TaxID=246614 RepID=UPI003D9F62EB